MYFSQDLQTFTSNSNSTNYPKRIFKKHLRKYDFNIFTN